jgi:hypothetical protein
VGEGVISLFFVGESLPEKEEGTHRRDRRELARKPSSLAVKKTKRGGERAPLV